MNKENHTLSSSLNYKICKIWKTLKYVGFKANGTLLFLSRQAHTYRLIKRLPVIHHIAKKYISTARHEYKKPIRIRSLRSLDNIIFVLKLDYLQRQSFL